MRSFSLISVICALLLLCTVSTAWTWNPNGLVRFPAMLGRREDTGTTATDSTATAAATVSTYTASATSGATDSSTASDSTATGTNSGTQTGTATGTGTDTGTITGTGTHTAKETGKGSKSNHTTTSISIDPRDPPGGVSMLTPDPFFPTYYKIGDNVTFAWNYTSLQVTPTAINVIATCSENHGTWTLTSNMSVEETGKVVWDTSNKSITKTAPLLTASYTLIIYDADTSISDFPSPGHLSSQNRLIFGMYISQPYTPLSGYFCVTCNDALSLIEKNALMFAAGMVTITVLSFTWFAGDFGVFST